MAYNQNQAGPFWDFIRSLDPQAQHFRPQGEGFGVDHSYPEGPGPHIPGAFPFGGPGAFGAWEAHGHGPHGHPHRSGWGGRGGGFGNWRGHGRRGGRSHSRSPSPPPEGDAEHAENPETGRESGGEEHGRRRHCRGRRNREHHEHRGRGGFGGPRGARGPPPAPFDFGQLLNAIRAHPLGQALGTMAEQSFGVTQRGNSEETMREEASGETAFVPPVDLFDTVQGYVLHVAVPGAKKEDVGVNWDAEKGELNVAGVVYRSGDEEFLKTLSKAERKIGMFERTVRLPPGRDDKDEVNGDAITARLEDGILYVTVPKVEKEWTEVKKVDIL